MRYHVMKIGLGLQGNLHLEFQLIDNPITNLWCERMAIRDQWCMDNPDRFFGFNSVDQEKNRALGMIRSLIETINQYHPIIDRKLESVEDQDTLNYLHHVFEIYHGQLDQQDHEFWNQAPSEVKMALANLNLAVHRCESLREEKFVPRFVCTWFGMPKTQRLDSHLQQQHGVETTEFGGVYLHYVEIGKTAEDMACDNDRYMADEMFQPFTHYSADFQVDFYDEHGPAIDKKKYHISEYFDLQREFFAKFGIKSADDIRIRPLKFKLAQLVYESVDKDLIMSQVRDNQFVAWVTLE